jgi:formate dehydrogenase maturation protein FdhE
MSDYRELQYRGVCRACGRTIQTGIIQPIGKNAGPEWVRCAECESINRIRFARDETVDVHGESDNR